MGNDQKRVGADYIRIALTGFCIFVAFARAGSIDGPLALQQGEAIVCDKTLAIDHVLVREGALEAARETNGKFPRPDLDHPEPKDGQAIDRSWDRGHLLPGKAPGLTFLALPTVWTFFKFVAPRFPILTQDVNLKTGVISLLFTVTSIVPISIATMVLVHRFHSGLGIPRRRALFLTMTYGFGTLAFYYGTNPNPWQVINAVTWILLSAFWRAGHESRLWLTCVLGCLCGFTAIFHYSAAALLPLFAAFVIFDQGLIAAAIFCLGGGVGLIPILAYHHAAFGGLFITPYARRIDAIGIAVSSGIFGYTVPSPVIAAKLLFNFSNGLFLYMPVSLIAFWARRKGSILQNFFWLAVVGSVGFLMLNAARHFDWQAGEGFFGPRYFLPGLPFLWLLIVDGSCRLRFQTTQILAWTSVFLGWMGAQFGENPLFFALAFFVLRGPSFPILSWAEQMLKVHTQGRSQISSLGIITLLVVALFAIWRKHFLANDSSEDAERPNLLD